MLIVFSVIFKEGFFNPQYDEIKIWSDKEPLTFDDFKGYADFFTKYDASIASYIKYQYDSENTLERIDAVCYRGRTWVNPWSRGNRNLLRHEAYHFKITEMVARMARKAAYHARDEGADKDSITVILAYHTRLERKFQKNYDEETNHGLIVDKQSEWQYIIDSTLFELDAYWTSNIFQTKKVNQENVKYYRHLNINERQQLYGSNELMPYEEVYVNHYKFIYDDTGNIKEIIYYSGGRVARDYLFKVSKININRIGNDTIEWTFYNRTDNRIECDDKYHKKRLILSNNRLIINYFDIKGNQKALEKNVYERIYNLDFKGRIISCIYFDENDNQIVNRNGVYRLKFYYNNDSIFLANTIKSFNKNNNPTINRDGVFQHNYTYDREGNKTSYSEKDLEGRYLYKNAYAIRIHKYDNLGRITHTMFLDGDSNLIENEKGIAIHSYSDDRYGNINRYSRYNSNNVLKADKDGYAQYYYKYDINRKLLIKAGYDTGSKLVFDEEGYGKIKYTYDSLGRRHTITNLDAYGYLLNREGSGAITVLNYDTINNMINGYYLDENGERDTTNLGGAAFQETYDENNNLIELKLFDLEGNLFATKFNTAIYRYQYDDNGNKIRSSYYTSEDKPSFANKGAHINDYVYSKENWLIERSYRDTTGKLIEYDGYAKIKWKLDSIGNEIETRYYNKHDKLVDSGIAIIRTEWGQNGNIIIESEFNHLDSGLVMKKYEWDEHGNIMTSLFYTMEGFKTVNEYLIHKYVFDYRDGVYYGESYYDTLGNLVEADNVAWRTVERDSRGNIIKKKTFDRFGNLIIEKGTEYAIVEYIYDDYDRVISEKYYDEHQQPAFIEGKYYKVLYKSDKSGKILWKGFFDQHDELTINKDGVALYRREYNRNNYAIVSNDLRLRDAKKLIDDIDW